jgi:zinc finger protein DZIP1
MAWAPEYLDHGARVPTSDADDGLVPHPPFYFDSRRVRIDWRLLHSLDLGQIQIRTDLDALSRVLDLIAYGDLEAEDVRNLSETNFLKIFRLAQMIVEYLLYVQTSLNRESKYYQVRRLKGYHPLTSLNISSYVKSNHLNVAERERVEEGGALHAEAAFDGGWTYKWLV